MENVINLHPKIIFSPEEREFINKLPEGIVISGLLYCAYNWGEDDELTQKHINYVKDNLDNREPPKRPTPPRTPPEPPKPPPCMSAVA